MANFSEKCNRLLVYLWMPLSVGSTVLGSGEEGRVQIHHVLILLPYVYAVLLSVAQKTLSSTNAYLAVLFLYVAVSGALTNYADLSFWLKLFSFFGVMALANHLSKVMSIEEFVCCSVKSLTVTFVLSLVFAAAFHNIAFNVVDDKLSLNSFYSQKNTYGRLVYFLIFFYACRHMLQRRRWRFRDVAFIALTLAALVLSNSRTSLGVAVMVLGLLGVAQWSWINRTFRASLVMLVAICVGLVLFGVISFVGVGDNHDSVSILGLLVPLSGRATIWDGVITGLNTEHRWWFGFGLEGFYNTPYAKYVTDIGLGKDFVPGDSHNGYIDLVANLGLVGAVIYFVIISRFLGLVRRINTPGVRGMLYIFVIIYLSSNFTESFFVKTSNITSFMFMLMFLYAYKLGPRKSVATSANSPLTMRNENLPLLANRG